MIILSGRRTFAGSLLAVGLETRRVAGGMKAAENGRLSSLMLDISFAKGT
jgi:hypothetical protein